METVDILRFLQVREPGSGAQGSSSQQKPTNVELLLIDVTIGITACILYGCHII